MRKWFLSCSMAVACHAWAGLCVADGPSRSESAATAESEPAPMENDAVRIESRARVEAISIRSNVDGSSEVLNSVSEAVLRFGDPTRANKDGSLWIWGDAGRPAAALELYRNEVGDWVYVLNWLSGTELTAEREGTIWWTPSAPTVKFSEVVGARPAATEALRATQMRRLARRFAAHEIWDPNESRYELRLLSSPVHRYRDDDAGIVDGAAFVLANGTNPEILLLLEARSEGEAAAWQYGLARLGHAEMHVSLDDVEVWTQPRVDPSRPDEAYWLHFDPAPTRLE